MENTKYGRRREGRWTPIRAKAQDTRANPNSWETHLVRKRWDIELLRALSPGIMMMMMMNLYMQAYIIHLRTAIIISVDLFELSTHSNLLFSTFIFSTVYSNLILHLWVGPVSGIPVS